MCRPRGAAEPPGRPSRPVTSPWPWASLPQLLPPPSVHMRPLPACPSPPRPHRLPLSHHRLSCPLPWVLFPGPASTPPAWRVLPPPYLLWCSFQVRPVFTAPPSRAHQGQAARGRRDWPADTQLSCAGRPACTRSAVPTACPQAACPCLEQRLGRGRAEERSGRAHSQVMKCRWAGSLCTLAGPSALHGRHRAGTAVRAPGPLRVGRQPPTGDVSGSWYSGWWSR